MGVEALHRLDGGVIEQLDKATAKVLPHLK